MSRRTRSSASPSPPRDLMEFCTEKELVAQTGHEAHEWPLVIVKELVDNGIDACEEAEVAPVVKITITTGKRGKPTCIVIEDNGPGIPAETISGIIDLQRQDLVARSVHQPDPGPSRQCSEDHLADGLCARRQDQG